MTELQLGLIGLGATAVVGVFGYNKWQEFRQRKLAQAVLNPHHEDVLLGESPVRVMPAAAPVERSEPEIRIEAAPVVEERIEPVFVDPHPAVPADDMAPAGAEVEMYEAPEIETPAPEPVPVELPAQAAAGSIDELSPEAPVDEVPAELLDPRLEFIVAMELVEPVSAHQILHSQRATLVRLNKPVHWVGYNERSREWQRLKHDSDIDVRRLRVGLQLVNRLGPISDGDLSIFTGAMQALADELMAVVDMPPSRVLDQAAEIDRFCAAVDLEIGLNLVSRASAFSGTKIRALAEAAGMVLGVDGLFTRYVDHGERVFMQMSEIAKRFADTLQGALVDDNRQPLSESQLDHIRREFIGKPQATMASFGLPAGSPQALRLFS